ncbi:MAG: VCBS repeat-containing protein [Desulfuromusa sp.]|nr:VCBS repeat-containing protein [Desulfuromusa sp.]
MLNTGCARYAVKIDLPPGTAGHTPSLVLQYDSGLGFSTIASGWGFEPESIKREVDKGVPRYVDGPNGIDDDADNEIDESDEVDIFVGPDGEELVKLENGTYRARIEGGFNRFRRVQEGWQVDRTNRTCLNYGLSPESREEKPGNGVFRWLLEKSTDVNGNTIEYRWITLAGSENRKFLAEIRYGSGSPPWNIFYFIKFNYEERTDWRVDCRSGFPIKTAHRLSGIDIGIQGCAPELCRSGDWNGDGSADSLISRYCLEYDSISPAQLQLVQITRYGADGVTLLPPISFSYSTSTPAKHISVEDAVIGVENAPPVVMDSELVDLVDLNRDGLPDMLHTDYAGGQHLAYLNQGQVSDGDRHVIRWSAPTGITSSDQLTNLLQLTDKHVNLADMNGDGISDLVHTTITSEVYYFVNQGNVGWGEKSPMSIRGTTPPAPFAFANVKTADLDFNKRMDVVKSTESGYSIWFNYCDGIYSREVITPGARYAGQVIQFSESGVDFTDMNGDRISDVVWVTPGSVIFCAGFGHGRFADGIALPIPDTVLSDGSDSQISHSKLTDINGDGLADLVVERAVTNQIWYWLNLGTDSFSAKYTIIGIPTEYSPNMVVRWADMNGNGSTDLVYADSTATEKLRIIDICEAISGSVHPNLLTGIDNGLGKRTSIFYQSSTEQALAAANAGTPWSTTVPFPIPVVSRVEVDSGIDLDLKAGTDIYLKSFVYRDGFYEDREHQFRGFAKVTAAEPGDETIPAAITISEFYTGGPDGVSNDDDTLIDEISFDNHREEEALKGLIRAYEIRDGNGKLYSRKEKLWRIRNLPLNNPEDKEIRLAINHETSKLIYEGTEIPEIIWTNRTYDDFGNVLTEQQHGALSLDGDERYTVTEYINDTSLWLIGLPFHSTLTDADSHRIKESFTYYDGAGFIGLAVGQATAGHVTRQRAWVNDDNWIDTARNQYEVYGNIIATLDPNDSRRSYVWDSELHTYPIHEEIETADGKSDLTVAVDYNLGLGVITESRDFNNQTTSYFYDIFARPTATVRPGDTPELPSQMFRYCLCDPFSDLLYRYDVHGNLDLSSSTCKFSSIKISTRETSGQTGTFDTVQYVDGMGRKICSVDEGVTDYIVKEMALFDVRGLKRYLFLPYPTTEEESDNRPVLSQSHFEKVYDGTGRELQTITPPDEDGVRANSSITYQPLSATQIDARGHITTSIRDGLERLLAVEEHNMAEIYTTSYAYDVADNLVSIVDNRNNLKTMTYDGLGRRTSMTDPDRGIMEYEYDAASNLIRTLDNKNQEISYSYDRVGRLVSKNYLDNAAVTPDVSYLYDQVDPDYPSARNLAGRLATVHDLSGARFFSYDARGNIDWLITRIQDGEQRVDFRSENEFDTMGRVTTAVFPDGDRVEFNYNNRSLLANIPGFVEILDYHVSGGIETISYANSIATNNQYDPRYRLLNLATTQPSGTALQDMHYKFDPTNNISAIVDQRPIAPNLPENACQNFAYDDLNRLVHAEGAGYGAISLQYNSIGNLVFKSSPAIGDPQHIDDSLINLETISYGGAAGSNNRIGRQPGDAPGPHALTATASGLGYQYDDNGNVINRTGDQYEWDFNDRLIRTLTPETTTSYTYNADGKRVIKKVAQDGTIKTTWYVTDNYEVRDGMTEKYIFAGKRRVARVTGRLATVGTEINRSFSVRPGANFISFEMAVSAAELFTFLDLEDEIWTWDNLSQSYLGYIPSVNRSDFTELLPGQGYIIRTATHKTLTLSGARIIPQLHLTAGWNLIGALGDRELTMNEVVAATGYQVEAVWGYDTITTTWYNFMVEKPQFLNTLAAMLPGHAYWLKIKENIDLDTISTPLTKTFFHPDHLGSSSLATDASGAVVERIEYYPYGRSRYESRAGFDSSYKYTDKELDQETGLMYYEARYYDSVIGRFMSVDPLLRGSIKPFESYSAFNNNPLRFVDPSGKTSWEYAIPSASQQKSATKLSVQAEAGEESWWGAGGEIAGIGVSFATTETEGERVSKDLVEGSNGPTRENFYKISASGTVLIVGLEIEKESTTQLKKDKTSGKLKLDNSEKTTISYSLGPVKYKEVYDTTDVEHWHEGKLLSSDVSFNFSAELGIFNKHASAGVSTGVSINPQTSEVSSSSSVTLVRPDGLAASAQIGLTEDIKY